MGKAPFLIRIHSTEGTFVGALVCLGLTLAGFTGMAFVSQVSEQDEVFWNLFMITGFTFAFGAGTVHLLTRPLWAEIGARFTYRALTGIYTHEWDDVESIQVMHAVQSQGDEDNTWYSLTTSLIVTMQDNKRIDLGASPREKRDKIIRVLLNGLNDPVPGIRRRSAVALGRLRPDAFPDLRVDMTDACETQRKNFEKEAAAAKGCAAAFEHVLANVDIRLTEATRDSSGNARRAASESLRRIRK